MSDFLVSLKSTIDKKGYDLAQSLGVSHFIDLDDYVNTAKVFQSDETSLLWSFHTLQESPVDPLYLISFSIGVKVSADPGNYNVMRMVSSIRSVFTEGQVIPVYDYSGAVAGTQRLGYFTTTDVRVDPQQFDNQTGLRFVNVMARAVREV